MIEPRTITIAILAVGIAVTTLPFLFFRNKRKEIALAIFSFIFSILVVETLLMLFHPQMHEHDKMFDFDPYLGWRFVPNNRGSIVYGGEARHYIKINSLGFRDNPPPQDSNDETRKILVLGDSFVTNISVRDDDVFTEVMEQQLKNTSVLNFGVNGYGQTQELLLTKWLDKVNPNLVVLVIYVRNDFSDNLGGHWRYPRPIALLDKEDSKLMVMLPPPRKPDDSTSTSFWYSYRRSHLFTLVNGTLNTLIHGLCHAEQSEQEPSIDAPYKA